MGVSLKGARPSVVDCSIEAAASDQFLVVTKQAATSMGLSMGFVPGAVVLKTADRIVYIRAPGWGAGGWDFVKSVAGGRVRNMTIDEQVDLRPAAGVPDALDLAAVGSQIVCVVVDGKGLHKPGDIMYVGNDEYYNLQTATWGSKSFAKQKGFKVRRLRPGEVVTIEA
jgi:hypothetical protein